MTARIRIVYCVRCRWMLRATWLAQELLSTFEDDIYEVSLRPGHVGAFEVWVGDKRVWSRAEDGEFPQPKELKRRVRDEIAPDRDLGHVDR